jgi:hypothetical protein
MASPKKKSSVYAWEVAREMIHEYITGLNNPQVFAAWIKCQLVIEAQARFHRHVGHTLDEAVAMAWEDFDTATRGKGEPSVAGAVFIMWSRLPAKNDRDLQQVYTEAFKAAQDATEPSRLRYHSTVRNSRVLTLKDDFDLPEAIALELTPVSARLNNAKDIKQVLDAAQGFKERGFTLVEGGVTKAEQKPEAKPKAKAQATPKPEPQPEPTISPVRLVDPDDVF